MRKRQLFTHRPSAHEKCGSEVVSGGKRFVDETPHGGYYTKADVAESVSLRPNEQSDDILQT